jgi:hypothetical protein
MLDLTGVGRRSHGYRGSMTTIVDKDKKEIVKANNRYGICGATKTDGSICKLTHGQGTDHAGEGRCEWHEDRSNNSLVQMYQIPALQDRMEFYLRDREIYSLDREIALNRSYLELFDKHIAVFASCTKEEISELGLKLDADSLTRSIVTITKNIAKLIQTKHEIEVGRKYVIDIKVVHAIMGVIGEIIDTNVIDTDIKEAINHGLNRISLPVASQ